MQTTQRNRVRYTSQSSQEIGTRASQQRMARNIATQYVLAHPNVSKNRLQRQLTLWRNQDPDQWHASVACQRPGLFKGRLTVRQFHQADARVLRECQREIKFANLDPEKSRKAKPPRHGNHPSRDPNPQRLFHSRKAPTTLVIEDNTSIRQVNANTIIVDGMTLHLAKPIPAEVRIVTVHIRERESSIRKSRNRPLAERSYEINLVINVPDPEPKPMLGKDVGLDAGVIHTLTDSEGQHHNRPQKQLQGLQDQADALLAKQNRLKHGSRQWNKCQKAIRRVRQQLSNVHDNWEHHTAKRIAENNDVVVMEKLRHANMRGSARGTSENPGRNVAAKSGLNRSLSRARLGAMQAKQQRHCEKTGAHFIKVEPRHTSTTCSSCKHCHQNNRKSQAEFRCGRCGHEAHADVNAALNILHKGQQLILLYLLLCLNARTGGAVSGRRVRIPPSDDHPRSGLTKAGATGPEDSATAGLAPAQHRAHAVRT